MIRIAFIGAGSLGFTYKLVNDLQCVPEFAEMEIRLQDISEANLDRIYDRIRRDLDANESTASVMKTFSRQEAVEGADYIINVVRIGGLDALRHDVEIPMSYGIDQCIGDTLCAGGIMYGQRGMANILELCEDIKKFASPKALLLNYANPMAMLTWIANTYGGVNCVGLCHGVQGGHAQITSVIEEEINRQKGIDLVDEEKRIKVDAKDVHYICAGINHQTWFTQVDYQGVDWIPLLPNAFENHSVFSEFEKVRVDMLKRFGYYSTESNGHLSEYLAWYRKRPEDTHNWVTTDRWINGESAGYLHHCVAQRHEVEEDSETAEITNYTEYKRSVEHGSYIIEALETGRTYRGHFNRINGHTITNLPKDCVIEAPGYVDKTGIHMTQVGDIPLGCAAVCSQSVHVQRLSVQAALTGNVQLLRQAFMMDPLTGAVCNPPEIWQLVDDLLIAQQEHMPQWQEEAKRAELRQETARENGTRIPLREDFKGGALRDENIARVKMSDAEAVGAA